MASPVETGPSATEDLCPLQSPSAQSAGDDLLCRVYGQPHRAFSVDLDVLVPGGLRRQRFEEPFQAVTEFRFPQTIGSATVRAGQIVQRIQAFRQLPCSIIGPIWLVICSHAVGSVML